MTNEWKRIDTQEDIDELLDTYGGFHDSCLVSTVFHSSTFVDDNLSMYFGDTEESSLTATFQRQWRPKTLEMRFIGLRGICLSGVINDLLYESYLAFQDNLLPGEPKKLIVWSDRKFHANEMKSTDSYIIANYLEWRIVAN